LTGENHGGSRSVAFVGFDSAWADNPRAPGAVCAASLGHGKRFRFDPPRLVSFDQAVDFIDRVRDDSCVTIVAIDQPTIVPNCTSSRPVDRVTGSVVAWAGGGVQPANRSRVRMFGDGAPIWRFLSRLDCVQDPERARAAQSGLFLIEVFPTLALLSIDSAFFGRLQRPRYNPSRRKTFRIEDWRRVVNAVTAEARRLGWDELAGWCGVMAVDRPRKPDQDLLDSTICLLVAIRWRLGLRPSSAMIGDLSTGYMVTPVSEAVRARLTAAANERSVPIDGHISKVGHV